MKYRDLIDTLDKFEIAIQRTDPLYFNAIEKLSDVRDDLSKLDANEHLLTIVRPYLSKWGDMARVVERDDLDWEEYASLIRSLEEEFNLLKGKRFVILDFQNVQVSSTIVTIYEMMKYPFQLGGPTNISKVAHLINPEIFVMWDMNIRTKYHKINRNVGHSGMGYLKFLRLAQQEIVEALHEQQKISGKSLVQIENEVRKRYKNKTIARLIDEYNYAQVHPQETW